MYCYILSFTVPTPQIQPSELRDVMRTNSSPPRLASYWFPLQLHKPESIHNPISPGRCVNQIWYAILQSRVPVYYAHKKTNTKHIILSIYTRPAINMSRSRSSSGPMALWHHLKKIHHISSSRKVTSFYSTFSLKCLFLRLYRASVFYYVQTGLRGPSGSYQYNLYVCVNMLDYHHVPSSLEFHLYISVV